MPNPKQYKDKNKFMSACIKDVTKEGRTQDQAIGKCEGMWNESLLHNATNYFLEDKEPVTVEKSETTYQELTDWINGDTAPSIELLFEGLIDWLTNYDVVAGELIIKDIPRDTNIEQCKNQMEEFVNSIGVESFGPRVPFKIDVTFNTRGQDTIIVDAVKTVEEPESDEEEEDNDEYNRSN